MRNKKTIIILILILLVGIIGITIAYFSNTTSIGNLFSTKKYGSTITEEFISPDSWLPGDETSKSIVATNTGEVDQAVRISYTEKWLDSYNNELSGWIHEDGSKSSHTTEEELSNDERVAIINFDNNDDWTYKDGYYYYNYKLSPNESTSSLIKSVTFNPKTKLDDTCTTTISDGKKTITCNSSGSDYDNAKYTLTFKIETVQFNKYMNAWNTDVAILNEQSLFCNAFEVGEVVEYNGSEYYVLKDSSTNDDYVTLLKKNPLTASEVNQYSDNYVSQDGEYPYYINDTCNENNETGCSTNYDTSSVKKIVDGWSSSFSDDLVSIDGYKSRIISNNDFNIYLYDSYGEIEIESDMPGTLRSEENSWTSLIVGDSNNSVFSARFGANIEKVYNKAYISPVINLKKSAINDACVLEKNEVYSTGDLLSCNGEDFYVIKNNTTYVSLLKKYFLTPEEINAYSNVYTSIDGEYPFCTDYYTDCYDNYDTSNIKLVVDNWANKFDDNLKSVQGYKSRLLKIEELRKYFGYEGDNSTSNTPAWIKSFSKYWSMDGFNYGPSVIRAYGISYKITDEDAINNKLYIRPVVNMKKEVISSYCTREDEDNEIYYLGQIISYKNNDYCVINNNPSHDYVTLIKQEPLTYDELITYNNGYEIGRNSVDNNSGIISYYKSDTCYYNSDSDKNTSGCSNDYNNSNIKNVVNNWSNTFSNDLKEIDGYKTRLITTEELKNMGHIFYHGTAHPISEQKSDYDCLYVAADYWAMDSMHDYSYLIDIISNISSQNGGEYIDKMYAVRPVINLKKCALTNTCE